MAYGYIMIHMDISSFLASSNPEFWIRAASFTLQALVLEPTKKTKTKSVTVAVGSPLAPCKAQQSPGNHGGNSTAGLSQRQKWLCPLESEDACASQLRACA